MIFFENGPDVPDELITRHQQGKVVFFCGAGISYAADLPGFCGLVEKIYDGLMTSKTDDEEEAYNAQNYDRVLNLLEKRLPGGYQKIADKLHEILKADYGKAGACDAHQALLRLSKNDQETLKLVTTNFDAIFDHTLKQIMPDRTIKNYCAPALPLAKEGRWDGIVYLHGKLSTDQQPQNPLDLVLTSAQFGEAYLTEGWAARFVSQLFQNYTICFVGYSLSDPILVYMTDAIQTKEDIYAFADYKTGKKEAIRRSWENKGVIPILYTVGTEGDYSALPKTLSAWADQYDNKSAQACDIVKQYAAKDPKTLSESEKDFVLSQMEWALTHESGEAIKVFAQMEPLPPFNWADYLIKWVKLEQLDKKIEGYFFEWLLRYADKMESFIWCMRQDSLFLSRLKEIIFIFVLQKSYNMSDRMKKSWDLFLSGWIYEEGNQFNHEVLSFLGGKSNGMERYLFYSMKIREIFNPKIKIKEIVRNDDTRAIEWGFIFQYGGIAHLMASVKTTSIIRFFDLNKLIEDTLFLNDFSENLFGVNKELNSDLLFFDYFDNQFDGDNYICYLIFCLRVCFLQEIEDEPEQADKIILQWFNSPFPVFKRMALFGACQKSCISPDIWLGWLCESNILYSKTYFREVCRLLALQANQLTKDQQIRLEKKILETIPSNNKMTYILLLRMTASGCKLGEGAQNKVGQLSTIFSKSVLEKDDAEKIYLYGPEYFDLREEDYLLPNNKEEIPDWLRSGIMYRSFYHYNFQENWRKGCQNRFEDCIWVIKQLNDSEACLDIILREALIAWRDENYVLLSWNAVIDLINAVSDPLFEKIRLPIARWLRSASQEISKDQKDIFLSLCHRLMSFENFENVPDSDLISPDSDLISRAINSSIATTTKALISYGIDIGEGKFPDPDFREIIDKICQADQQNYQMGRVIIFHDFINDFYEIDQAWAESIIETHCDWEKNEQSARVFWESYISSQYHLEPLMVFARQDFFKIIDHIGSLSEKAQKEYLVALLDIALKQIEAMNKTELQEVFAKLTAEQLAQILICLNDFCPRQDHKISQYFQEEIIPFWEDYWPKSIDKKSVSVSNQLVKLCFSVDESFPQAFQLFKDWFQPIADEGNLTLRMDRLAETDLVEKFPEEILKLFTAIIPDDADEVHDITSNLEKIKSVRSDLEKDSRYQSLLKHTI